MRNLSFALTTRQMRDRTKTVTRRKGTYWARVLKPGDLVCAVEKSQGIPKGGLVRIGVIRVVSARTQSLDWPIRYGYWSHEQQNAECAREGFPELGLWGEFVQMFCRHMGGTADQIITRIEFEHVEGPVSR